MSRLSDAIDQVVFARNYTLSFLDTIDPAGQIGLLRRLFGQKPIWSTSPIIAEAQGRPESCSMPPSSATISKP